MSIVLHFVAIFSVLLLIAEFHVFGHLLEHFSQNLDCEWWGPPLD